MSAFVVVAALAAVLCWPRRATPRERLATVAGPRSVQAGPAPVLRRSVLVSAALAIAAVIAIGGASWWVAVLVAAALAGARVRPKAVVAPHEVALTADLMAACMAGGAGVADALLAASRAVDDHVRELAQPVIASLRCGSPPDSAWAGWLADERLAPVARSCARSSGSGAAVAAELARVASRVRSRQRALVQERVAKASIWVVLPLGLCFLPAFVAVGVVPLVVGLLQTLR